MLNVRKTNGIARQAVKIMHPFFNLFFQINKDPVLEVDGIDSQIETVKKERFEKVLKYFSLREQKSDQILSSPVPVADPSL